jgi:partner of Y14 and mago protein
VTDPAKRIKNLRKRLREIESIEQKIAAGEQKLEKDQLDKVARKKEIISEIEQLTCALGNE